jgi:hypothetical protein
MPRKEVYFKGTGTLSIRARNYLTESPLDIIFVKDSPSLLVAVDSIL